MTEVQLDVDLRLSRAEDLRARLLEVLDAGGPVMLDAHRVEWIDVAGAQVLLAFRRDARAAGRAVEWATVTSPMLEVLRRLGLAGELGIEDGGGT